MGGPQTYNHYPIGWAMAFNTPYKLFKRYASHEGGIADAAIISWPNRIAARGRCAITTSTSATLPDRL
ncbi:arylsulfatase domain protein [Mycobacterium xenopi 4042]|uniref:Arylsulfatase domain protein n=1 Tax=Mycobacterium xenopi 4042 TaxID=1299334 RepID=X7YJI9_MYCXE|nr:arylsulfatase domain protein [Mycobacterium xenopi 4042]